MYCVADYGIGVNPYQAQSLSKLTGYEVSKDNLLELKRLCRVEPKKESLQLTQFIAGCHKILKKKGIRYIVSFSDPDMKHNGGIYKAANFKYLGKTDAAIHTIDENNIVRHRRYYFRYARRKNITVAQARKELGLKTLKTAPKDRWFIQINSKRLNPCDTGNPN